MNANNTLPDWSRAHGGPILGGSLRQSAEDFAVTEVLGFEPDGQGECEKELEAAHEPPPRGRRGSTCKVDELADQDGFSSAQAYTFRTRAGIESKPYYGFSAMAELISPLFL